MRTLFNLLFVLSYYFIGFLTGYIYSEQINAGGCGTASFINSEGYLVTAHHVVGNKTKGFIIYNQKEYPAIVIGGSIIKDVAFIKTNIINHEYLIFNTTFEKGVLGVYGYPEVNIFGLSLKVSTGLGEKGYLTSMKRNIVYVETNIYPGNSGGPILDQNGRIIGILTTGFTDPFHKIKNNGSNYGYGTSSVEILEQAKELGILVYINNELNQTLIEYYHKLDELQKNQTVVYFCTGDL